MKLLDKFYYRINKGDTLESIAIKYGVGQDNIVRNNPDIPIYSGEIVRIDRVDYLVHFVAPTDTLESISKKYDVTVEELISCNELASTKLYIGQTIKIGNKIK